MRVLAGATALVLASCGCAADQLDADVATSGETTVAPMAAEPPVPWPTTTTTTTQPVTTTEAVVVTAQTTIVVRPAVTDGDVWHALAMCETGGRMDNPNTGNGYYGYFQFALSTWQSVGGPGYPHEHDYATQLHYAQILQGRSGWGQWPACSRKLGLR